VLDDESGSAGRRRKLFTYADSFGLTRDERLELSEMLLRRDIASWKDLTDIQVLRMLDAFEGAALLLHLTQERSQVRM